MRTSVEPGKFFLVKEYYEFIKHELTHEELQNLLAMITEDIKSREIQAE